MTNETSYDSHNSRMLVFKGAETLFLSTCIGSTILEGIGKAVGKARHFHTAMIKVSVCYYCQPFTVTNKCAFTWPLLKGTWRIPESYLPSLDTYCENMASHRRQIMEKTQIVYLGPTNLCQHSTTDLTRGIMMDKHKHCRCRRHALSTILKLQAAVLYSIQSPTSW